MTKLYGKLLSEMTRHPHEGVFFAFNEAQFKKGMADNGYTDEKELVTTSAGAIGSQANIDKMMQYYKDMEAKIKAECNPDEIYAYEFANHECGYTGEDDEALAIVRDYFPDYTPSEKLRSRLFSEADC